MELYAILYGWCCRDISKVGLLQFEFAGCIVNNLCGGFVCRCCVWV